VLTAATALLALATAASSYGDTGNVSFANTDNSPNPQTDRVWYP
jgi:hypothetical protein